MADTQEKQLKLTEFNKEEVEAVKADIQAVLDKHNGQFVVAPLINPNGTLGAVLQILKKVDESETGVPSFIQADDLKQNESGSEAASAA